MVSLEVRAKMSESHRGEKNSMYGVHLTGEKNGMYGKKHSPETIKKISENRTGKTAGENHPLYGRHHAPETIARMSELKRGANHPMYGKHRSEETRQKQSDAMKHRGIPPEHQAKMRAAKKRNARIHFPEPPKTYHDDQGKLHYTQEARARISASRKGKLTGIQNPMFGRHHSPELLAKMSEERKGKPMPDEVRAKIRKTKAERPQQIGDETRQKIAETKRGKLNPNWRGGTSFEPYCPKFNKSFKDVVRERFRYRCQCCGAPESGRHHSVHHIDYNKNSICNGKEWGFVLLCQSCHGAANQKRWHWFNAFISYWIYAPAMNYCWGI